MKVRWPALLRLTRVLSEIASSLRRIGDALDRAYPIADHAKPRVKPAGLDALTSYRAEEDWEAEQEEDRRREAGYDRISLTQTDDNDV